MKAYQAIRNYYGDQTAARSGVPLINHIDEGLQILEELGASQDARDAFCLHPIFQGDPQWEENGALLFGDDTSPQVRLNVAEYRYRANSYLCTPFTDHYDLRHIAHFVGRLSDDVRHMLIADKVQNRKDFRIYHLGSHARSDQLERYFDLWLDYLDYNPGSDEPLKVGAPK